MMITLNLQSENFHLKEDKGNISRKVDDQTQINQHKEKSEQCIKWIYDEEKSYILGYN